MSSASTAAAAGSDTNHASATASLTEKAGLLVGRNRERRILVLYVGGTIGMKKNTEGALEPVAGYLSSEMRNMHELRQSREICPFDIVEYEQLLDSSDMGADEYLRIAKDIEKNYEEYDGFLIAHGTDTMHFTASALSFLLHNLAKPVIVTGAMVPLAEAYNDARRNLIIGMMLASNPSICEVCIFFNDSLFRGNRCDKVFHSYGAFASFNYPAVGFMTGSEFVLNDAYLLPQPSGAMSMDSDLSGRVATVHINADVDVEDVLAMIRATGATQTGRASVSRACADHHGSASEDASSHAARHTPSTNNEAAPLLNGLVLAVLGIGAVTGDLARKMRCIADAAEARHVVVCVVHQELSGHFTALEATRLRQAVPSVVYLRDMTIAAAETKMMYLFGKGLPRAEVKRLMAANLRGELTPPPIAKL